MTFKYLCFYSILLLCSPTLLWGQNHNEYRGKYAGASDACPVQMDSMLNDYTLKYSPPPIFSSDAIGSTNISAQQVINTKKTISVFTGDVDIEQHKLRIHADEVTHNNETQILNINGHVKINTTNLLLNADSGWMNLQTEEGKFTHNQYYMPETGLRGKTPSFSFSSDDKTVLIGTQFSTCPENKMDWYLKSSWLELDQNTATGTAKHTTFWVGGVPVFYFPWIRFPLGEERRSGFLVPNIGSSSSSGLEFSTPWYWNIAPNQDALITPTYLAKRGTMLATDYRYLTHSSRGNLNIEYLNNDKEYNDRRYLLHFDNKSKLSRNLSLSMLANEASDSRYLNDMGSNISVTNLTHLEKNALLKYSSGDWNAGLKVQDFQTIDQSIALNSRPYKRLPQITLKGKEELMETENSFLLGSLNSEWVKFDHESNSKEKGSRFHLYPKLSLPIQSNAWFVKPSAGYMFTQYDTTDTNGNDANLDATGLSVLSLDSGLFFERNISNGNYLQTLEPRLFYLNIPYKDQSLNPIFDTASQSFSFASLFRENRFTGIDRIGDANQLTVALSSRILNPNNGHELFNINIGRIYYFEDQQVSLNNIVNTQSSSDIITEIGANISKWRTRATFQWNTETGKSDKRSIQLNYAAAENAVFNIGYRFTRALNEVDNLEQTDISFAWPFAKNYSLLSRWNYSLTEKRDNVTLFGLQYESCCWALRLVSQRYIQDDSREDPYRTSIMFQFVLKGFGSISDRKATNVLKSAIFGYQPDY